MTKGSKRLVDVIRISIFQHFGQRDCVVLLGMDRRMASILRGTSKFEKSHKSKFFFPFCFPRRSTTPSPTAIKSTATFPYTSFSLRR